MSATASGSGPQAGNPAASAGGADNPAASGSGAQADVVMNEIKAKRVKRPSAPAPGSPAKRPKTAREQGKMRGKDPVRRSAKEKPPPPTPEQTARKEKADKAHVWVSPTSVNLVHR